MSAVRSTTRTSTTRRTVAASAAAAVVALALAACGGGGSASSSGASAPEPAAGGAARDGVSSGVADSGSVAGQGTDGEKSVVGAPAAPAATGRRLIRTADMTVQVPDVVAAGSKVRVLTTAAKGIVADERTTTGIPGEQPTSTITVRVPETGLDRVMDQVAAIGKVSVRSQSSQDVTDAVVDTTSRVATQRESVARVRALLAQATNIGQVVQIESELSRRQADLEALEAQLANLEGQTALATLSVSLTTRAPEKKQDEATGFLGGLRGGWDAFSGATTVVLTALGAVLPFLVLVALVGVPLRWALRRRTPRVVAGPPTTYAAPTGPPAP